MKTRNFLFVATLACLSTVATGMGGPGEAKAATITQTGSNPVLGGTEPTVPTEINAPLGTTFSQFNPALGTLTSVEVIFTATLNTSGSLSNESSSSVTFNFGVLTSFFFSPDTGAPASLNKALNVSTGTSNFTLQPSPSLPVPFVTSTTSSIDFFPALSAFVGTGSFKIDLTTLTTVGDLPDGIFSTVIPSGGGQGEIIYTYDTGINPTPLPATLPLFATGLGALGLLGWRKKKKSAALAA